MTRPHTQDLPSVELSLETPVNIFTSLDQAGVDYVDVDDQRVFVIYLNAIFNVTVNRGLLTAAEEATVDCWEAPQFRSGVQKSAETATNGLVDVLTTDQSATNG